MFSRDYAQIILLFPPLELKYMHRNESQVSDLYAIFIATSQKENVVFANYYFCWWQKIFDLNIGKLRPRTRATFLRICQCKVSSNQWV